MNAQDAGEEDTEQFDALFDVRQSIRYHDHRVAFFELLQRLSSAVSILLAGVIFMELLGSNTPLAIQIFSAVGAILTTFDLVVGFGKAADRYRDLKRKFAELEIKLMTGTAPAEVQVLRRHVEIDEPPVYTALNLRAREEMCASVGRDNQFERLHWWPRATANWYRWPNLAGKMKQKPRCDPFPNS